MQEHKLGQAAAALAAGDHAVAERLCGEILERDPRHPHALHIAALARHGQGDNASARELLRRVVEVDPSNLQAMEDLGAAELEMGNFLQAESWLRRLVGLGRGGAATLCWLALSLSSQGRHAEAVDVFRRAQAAEPANPGLHLNLANELVRIGAADEAIVSYEQALKLNPAYPEALNGLGTALQAGEKYEEAAARFRHAIDLRSDYVEAWCNLGVVLMDLGLSDEALRCLTRALEIHPGFVDALVGLGNLHAAGNRLGSAEDCYRKAIALKPGLPGVHMNLGHLLRDQGRVQDALDCYRVALALKPDYAEARWSLAMSRIPVMRGENDDLNLSRAEFAAELDNLDQWFETIRAAEGYTAVGVQQPFYLAYQEENNRDLLERYGRLCARLMTRWQNQQGFRIKGRRNPGPIRVGIVSRYFREHSVWSALMKGWFQQLDRERFALAAFCLGPKQNEETHYARSHAARIEQGTRGLRHWVETILEAQPDVLIYPEIGMDPMTAKLASLRLAPVQVAAWGHPETTGLPTMDYYMSGEMFEPPGAEGHYSEKLVTLPHLGCFVEPSKVDAAVPDVDVWGIDAHIPLLLCPGAPFKYAPEHDRIFPEIARRLGRCRLIFFTHRLSSLSEELRRRLESVFARSGLAFGDFVTFVPWQDKPQFFGLMQRADVYLDTIGFSGFNTAIQAVECGLPIVAREGRFMRGRLASGILKRMGLAELVAQSEENYVALAVRLARDVQYRKHVRSRIAISRQVLFEDLAPIRALEDLLIKV